MTEHSYELCFDTLANKLRLDIVQVLFDKSKTVSELCVELNVEQSRVSHALKILRECSFVEVKNRGKERIYSVPETVKQKIQTAKGIKGIIDLVEEHSKKHCVKCKKILTEKKVK